MDARENASFATSRPCIPNYLDLARFYPLACTAALLVMQTAWDDVSEEFGSGDLDEESPQVDDVTDESENMMSETPSRASDHETVPSFPVSRESSQSPPHARCSWEPIDNVDSNSQYSLFAQHQEYPDSISIACIADQSVIISLLRSAVYRRLAWGTTDPVMGLGFSPGSPMVQVFIAWPSTTWEDGLPLVAITGDWSEDHTLAVDRFDLTFPATTYELVHYLSKVFELAKHANCSGQARWLEWRFDFANYDKMESITVDKMASIRVWAEEAMPTDADERWPFRDNVLPKAPLSPAEPSVDVSASEPQDVGPPLRWTYLDIASGAADMKHPYETLHQWLWNRVACLRSVLPLIDMGTIHPYYVSLSRFAWNEGWDQSVNEENIHPKLSPLRSELLQQKSAYLTTAMADSLNEHAAADLLAKVCIAMAACSAAREQSKAAEQYGTSAACDHIWDGLVSSLHGTSSNVRYLPAVALPRSALTDRCKDPGWLASARYNIKQHSIYGSQHRDAAKLLAGPHSTLGEQAIYAGLLSIHPGLSYSKTTEHDVESEDGFEGVLNLVANDPVEAICDVVCTIFIPNLVSSDSSATLQHAAERFCLLPREPDQATARARGGTAYYHGICDLPSEHSGLASAYDLFCANVRSAGLSPETPDSLDFGILSAPPTVCRLSFLWPDSKLEKLQAGHPPPLAPDHPDESGRPGTEQLTAAEQSLALELPLLLVNHTPPEKILAYIGSHKHRMTATAAATFFGAVGLTGVPVFSLVTDGCRAVLTCAWAEKFGSFQRIKIAERNGVLFDLRNPLSAFHFATFLVRLKHEHGQKLRERFDDQALAHLRERLEQGEWETRWTMSHYVAEQSNGDMS
ncbi:hypothetical protein CONPUDRAFT_157949 [Coniophora puteana RWD-64-598 SS2]|uniref:Uncharacterized protein n=1 Tax=Coniophora puteana (strain RWD-64-598) TaxID=741705 RepID=A0A5M3MD62_CONPW|nr:uncharacterized protein CONPUDRAFT_157949 [Coniophora puteana RWD-64-598 SS2]EIW76790.1 hypothetical protein CONPUDRAFT_157949 [Coniophora puteana RWD-64-598 SS2]